LRFLFAKIPPMLFPGQFINQVERKDLPGVGMAGKLEVRE
jgi:hypothetical protein